eukprot:CAMPEP_0202919244 /NCGR_PEP_ID=MMETSP1392-20130828/75380_1 /ASSEMBLY_ACC=CAM_ASM_000868 /TAXON_ID=225041 /ORGANISM="Chlamydomonas chlamydogama, Strain SAG 11-48b" /LENGTH=287 /DNA_ID=CAMNT_0049612537 /DNA_START=1 /DNA_END=861 /DNA_ORIENTATION=+
MNSLLVELVKLRPETQGDGPGSGSASPGARSSSGGASAAGTAACVTMTRHMSHTALQAFCHLHHLLLAVALQEGNSVVQEAQRDVLAFVQDPAARHKTRCPDLGVLLIEYLLVPQELLPWSAFVPPFLRELLSRNVYWALKLHGSRFGRTDVGHAAPDGGSEADQQRLQNHFESASTGLRNVMLQTWFANGLARPTSVAGLRTELGTIKHAYDELSGLPPVSVLSAFHRHARSVLQCSNWRQFLQAMRLGTLSTLPPGTSLPRPLHEPLSPRALMVAMLRQAVIDSY